MFFRHLSEFVRLWCRRIWILQRLGDFDKCNSVVWFLCFQINIIGRFWSENSGSLDPTMVLPCYMSASCAFWLANFSCDCIDSSHLFVSWRYFWILILDLAHLQFLCNEFGRRDTRYLLLVLIPNWFKHTLSCYMCVIVIFEWCRACELHCNMVLNSLVLVFFFTKESMTVTIAVSSPVMQ